MSNKIINFLLFHFMWPACVVGAAYNLWWPGLALLAVFAVWHYASGAAVRGDLGLVAVMLPVGMLVDTLWIQLGVLDYATPGPLPAIAPAWIAALWVALALALNHSLVWLQQRRLLAGAVLTFGSPFSYYCASKLGAVEWLAPAWQVILATGLSWAILIPIFLTLARHWREPETTSPSWAGAPS